ELSGTWQEYIDKTVDRINDQYGKRLLLHLSKYSSRWWTPRQLRKALNIEEDEKTIQRKLIAMVKGDLIEWGVADIDFRGLQDGTLNLILRHRFEKEIAKHQTTPDLRPGFRKQIKDLKRENKSLRGKLNQITGVMAEYQLANTFRSRKRFILSDFFQGASDTAELNMRNVRTRVSIQREDGKGGELDIVAESGDERVLLVEVRKRKDKSNPRDVEYFQEKAAVYQTQNPEKTIITAFLSLGGFSGKARLLCEQSGIAWAEEISYF
ncbi:MAG: hypothetical protein GY862_06520, partial [Gammaproteobacteria bacterium]|nr:hypothetical protein [Gammaproteobacteria bacterium]